MPLFAPYNFVPLNKKVVLPHWVNQISHDVPFDDGESGEFKVRITAKTPIFVKDGLSKTEEKNKYDNHGVQKEDSPHEFCQHKGQYYIPGSSIKGMVRNVLEIMSFGRMDKVNDHRYAVRDLSNNELYTNHFNKGQVYGGFLSRSSEDKYTIKNYAKPKRISKRILTNNRNDKSAKNKYANFEGSLHKTFIDTGEIDYGREIYEVNPNGLPGTLVFTGSASNNKKYEFVFLDQDPEQTELNVSDKVIEDFFFAYFDNDKKRRSKDWDYWKSKLINNEAIPIFFQKEGNVVKHLGLSYLYKLPYEHSVKDSIKNYRQAEESEKSRDLAEAIFGYIDDEHGSLKGRVHISHAFAKNDPQPVQNVVSAVLSSPKASYYPNYISQGNHNGQVRPYKTYNNGNISGWKRYPISMNTVDNPRPPNTSDKVLTRFRPLKEGAEFEFTIRYHNLRKVELGALYSALTFHDTKDAFHSIGMGKPLGYGAIDIELEKLDKKPYLEAYEAYMDAALKNTANQWHQSVQIRELISMSSLPYDRPEPPYMNLPQFRTAKNNNSALKMNSKIVGSKTLQSLITDQDVKQMKDWIAKESAASDTYQTVADKSKSVETMAKNAFKSKKAKFLAQLAELKARKAHEEANQPTMTSVKSLKRAKPVDAKVVGQKGNMVVFRPYVEGFEEKEFEIRYPAGFNVGTVIIVTMQAIRKGKDLQVQGYPKLK